MTIAMACSLESHDAAVALPETTNGGFRRTGVLLGFGDTPSHLHERRAFRVVPGATLDEFIDAAVLERNQPRRTRQIALHDAHTRLPLGLALGTKVDPEQFGLIDAFRRKEANGERIQRELNAHVGEDGL